jgi:hypothetical protein
MQNVIIESPIGRNKCATILILVIKLIKQINRNPFFNAKALPDDDLFRSTLRRMLTGLYAAIFLDILFKLVFDSSKAVLFEPFEKFRPKCFAGTLLINLWYEPAAVFTRYLQSVKRVRRRDHMGPVWHIIG